MCTIIRWHTYIWGGKTERYMSMILVRCNKQNTNCQQMTWLHPQCLQDDPPNYPHPLLFLLWCSSLSHCFWVGLCDQYNMSEVLCVALSFPRLGQVSSMCSLLNYSVLGKPAAMLWRDSINPTERPTRWSELGNRFSSLSQDHRQLQLGRLAECHFMKHETESLS